jgi:osmotically-inducible protein OsmY
MHSTKFVEHEMYQNRMSLSRLLFLPCLLLGVLAPCFLQGCILAAAGGAATTTVVATDRRTTGTIVDDQSIALKATHQLCLHKPLWNASHINTVSYNNVLLLVGQTPTEAFRNEAEEAVSDIPKIRRIHNELTVGEPTSLATRAKDTWITTQIKTKLFGSKTMSASRVKVITEDGVVYLMGVTTPEEQMTATDIARAINGVAKVIQIFEDVP